MAWQKKTTWYWLVVILVIFGKNNLAMSQSYDIYVVNVRNGLVTQVSSISDAGEFNPSWSPSGKKIAHDVVGGPAPFGQSIFITDVRTGISTLLEGAEGGNDAAWSPSGKKIAFDDFANLYVVPSHGGNSTLLRNDAADADWSPNNERLVFRQPSDGSIRTVDKNGGTETLVVGHGENPVWSPSGHWIAFADAGDIWKIKVNIRGEPLGSPVQVTTDPAFEGHPSWSPNSKKIVFHSNHDGDFDLWTISASGGAATRLTGLVGIGDFDPSFSNSGQFVAYAEFSTAALPKQTVFDGTALPSSFNLEQNYPNPFNPSTTIAFAVPKAGDVTLSVYNLLGQLVKTLHKGPIAAGHHKVVWDSADAQGVKVATGVYVYRLEAKGFVTA